MKLGRLILAGNPFYSLSAALLLYGLYLVSVDPQMFGQELAQLAFNFSSLELYEVLVVVTALLLARRALWYDATVLVLLFLLISQATFLTRQATWAVGGTAVALAIGKFWAFRRHLPAMNVPPTLPLVGLALLVVNVAFPLTFRHVVQADSETWPRLSRLAWLWLLPALVSLANLHRSGGRRDGRLLEQPWLPLLLHLLWVAATAVHLHSLNYLDGQGFKVALVAPALCALAWTAWHRAIDFNPKAESRLRPAFLVLAALSPLLATGRAESNVMFMLAGGNACALLLLAWRSQSHLAAQLGLASLVYLAPSMPDTWGRELFPDFSSGKALTLALAAYALLLTSLSRRPAHSLLGAIVVGLGTQFQFARLDYVEQFAMQHALLFVLLHSLRWTEKRGARALRTAAAIAWLAHSIAWLRLVGVDANWPVLLGGLLVLGVALLMRLVQGRWTHRAVAGSAALVALSVPMNFVIELLRITPSGYLVVLGSFAVFAVGTALAWTKPHWNPPAQTPEPVEAT
jgi:hypothetical protein